MPAKTVKAATSVRMATQMRFLTTKSASLSMKLVRPFMAVSCLTRPNAILCLGFWSMWNE